MSIIKFILNIVNKGGNSFLLGKEIFKNFFNYMYKYLGLYILSNGCYNYGVYKGEIMTGIKSSNIILLTKLQSFWFWLFEIEYKEVFITIIKNIAYFLCLPINIVFYMSIFIIIYLLSRILKIIWRLYLNRLADKIKYDNNNNNAFIEKLMKANIGVGKTAYDYDKDKYNNLLKMYIDLSNDYNKLKEVKTKANE